MHYKGTEQGIEIGKKGWYLNKAIKCIPDTQKMRFTTENKKSVAQSFVPYFVPFS